MSHYMTALAMQQTGLKPSTKIVLYWIADHYNHETGACFPSHNRLAKLCEMTRQSVITHIGVLKDKGFLGTTNRTRDNGSNTSCEYQLFLKGSDVKKIDTPSKDILHDDVNLFNNHNLGNNNLRKDNIIKAINNNPINASLSYRKYRGYTEDEIDISFGFFWESYPKKTGKQTAKKAFTKAINKECGSVIMSGLYKYVELCEKEQRPKKFILNPSTWLNGGHWDDEEVSFKEQKETSAEYLHSLLSGGILGIDNNGL